jgi:nitrogen fixation protein NifQ
MLAPLSKPPLARGLIHARIMAHALDGGVEDDLLAKMLASRALGIGALPADLGLGPERLRALLACRFPRLPWILDVGGTDPARLPEREDLVALMLRHAAADGARRRAAAADMAAIVAAACMGGNHLWEDLGLWSRADLSLLMRHCFPPLAAKNDRDMKWKKFLYKQLCLEEGIYVCRAPSCEVCRDYDLCFGREE